MKKILAFAMCLALMMTSFVFVSAEASATLTVGTVEGPFSAGDEVAIPVSITEWANAYATIELEILYDDTLLMLDIAEQSEFSGAMAASNANKFSLVCNPASERQANKLLGGEICVIYFYAITDIIRPTTVTVNAVVKGYAYGKDDNWTVTTPIEFNLVNGGVKVLGGVEHECVPTDEVKYDETNHWYTCRDVGCDKAVNVTPHQGGVATCNAKAKCSVCNVEYGEFNPANHAGGTEIRNESETYTGDVYCLSCEEIITRGEGTGPVIPTEYDATITVATINGAFSTGTEIAVPVRITEWANAYGSIEFTLDYDKTLLKIVSIEASETDFVGSMSVSNSSKFALIANPTSEKQADKLLGGEICVAYFTALANIDEPTVIGIKESVVYAYTEGKDDNWTDAKILNVNVVSGGIDGEGEDLPVECTHEGGEATCIAKAVCSLCGEEYGDVDETNHVGETELRNDSDYYTGDVYCLDCGEMIDQGDVIESLMGDANGDGEVNTIDSMIICQYYAGFEVEIKLNNADVNVDGKINTVDSMIVSQYYVELVERLPVTNTNTSPVSGSAIVSNVVTRTGKEVTITVALGESTAIGCYGATLEYDETALELVTMTIGEFGAVVNKDTKSASGFITQDITTYTELFSATFRILADKGSYKVDVVFDNDSTAKADQTPVVMNVTGGNIDVLCSHTGETEVRNASETYTGDVYCLDCGEMIDQGDVIESLMGDANGDGEVNTIDSMIICQHYAGFEVEIKLNNADVNGDGYVNARDAMLVAQFYVGLIDTFPVN
ncbi:MAG: hypothetical protein IJ944_05930 [Clostridia bacterium]|nr:hypothetical protein [Clostridia bacterium]